MPNGLDRDSSKWKLNEEESYRRRSLFYEVYTYGMAFSFLV